MPRKSAFRRGINWCPDRQKLFRFTSTDVTVIRPWPDPRAWHSSNGKAWVGTHPRMRLDYLPHQSHAPYPYRFEQDAWSTIPESIRTLVIHHSLADRQWMTLNFLARCPGAQQLLQDQPLLGAAAANLVLMRRVLHASTPKNPWRDLRAATRPAPARLVWARVARLLRWPSSRSFFRVLGRVRSLESERWDPWVLGKLPRIWDQPALRKILQHGGALQPGILEALGVAADHPALADRLPARLFLEATSEHDVANLAGTMHGLDHALFRNPRAPLPERGALRTIEDIEQWTAAILPVRPWLGPLPPPPLPGTDRIVPLDSEDALKQEGRLMNHCIGYGGFASRARALQGYGYRILTPTLSADTRSAATLWIEPSSRKTGHFQIGQIQGFSNGPVEQEVRRLVEQWLHDQGNQYQEHNNPIHDLWSPPPTATCTQWHQRLHQQARILSQAHPPAPGVFGDADIPF